MCHIMGATGRSFVCGFGANPLKNPHHRDSTLTMKEFGDWHTFDTRPENAEDLLGAMVGGPNNELEDPD